MTKIFLSLITIIGISALVQVICKLFKISAINLEDPYFRIVSEDHLTRCRRQASSSCILTPEVTEGPYYWNTSLMRQNVTYVLLL